MGYDFSCFRLRVHVNLELELKYFVAVLYIQHGTTRAYLTNDV